MTNDRPPRVKTSERGSNRGPSASPLGATRILRRGGGGELINKSTTVTKPRNLDFNYMLDQKRLFQLFLIILIILNK